MQEDAEKDKIEKTINWHHWKEEESPLFPSQLRTCQCVGSRFIIQEDDKEFQMKDCWARKTGYFMVLRKKDIEIAQDRYG